MKSYGISLCLRQAKIMTLVVWDDLAATAKDHPVSYGVSLRLRQAKIVTSTL